MRIRFETTECGRCGGTGHFDYNPLDGTICYGCNGSKRAYTKAGAAAREAYDALIAERCTKPVEDIVPGEKIWEKRDFAMFGIPAMFPQSGFYEVTESHQAEHGPNNWDITYPPHPKTGDARGRIYIKGTRVRVPNPEAERQIMREVARKHSGATLISNEAEDVAYAAEQEKRDAKRRQQRETRQARAEAKEQDRIAEREAKARAEADAWRAANADLVAYFDTCNPETFNTAYHGSMYHHAVNVRAGSGLSKSDTAWVREWIARDTERAAKPHYGKVGDKATITATLEARIDMGNSGFGTRYKVVMTEQATGAKLVSWTTGDWPWDLEEGEVFTFTATIAKHGEYRGERETDVKNVRIKKNAKK